MEGGEEWGETGEKWSQSHVWCPNDSHSQGNDDHHVITITITITTTVTITIKADGKREQLQSTPTLKLGFVLSAVNTVPLKLHNLQDDFSLVCLIYLFSGWFGCEWV